MQLLRQVLWWVFLALKQRCHMTRGRAGAAESWRLWEAARKSGRGRKCNKRTKCNSPLLLRRQNSSPFCHPFAKWNQLNLLGAGEFLDRSSIMEWCVTGSVLHYHLLVLCWAQKEVNFQSQRNLTFWDCKVAAHIWRSVNHHARAQQHFCYIQRVKRIVRCQTSGGNTSDMLFLCSFTFLPPCSEWCARLFPAPSAKRSEHSQP